MFLIPNNMKKHLLSCEEVSHIISEDQQLQTIKKIKLKMHIFICQKCLDYKKQIQFINKNSKIIKFHAINDDPQKKIEKSKSNLIDKYSSK